MKYLLKVKIILLIALAAIKLNAQQRIVFPSFWHEVVVSNDNLYYEIIDKEKVLEFGFDSSYVYKNYLIGTDTIKYMNLYPSMNFDRVSLTELTIPYKATKNSLKSMLIVFKAAEDTTESVVWSYRLNDSINDIGLTTKHLMPFSKKINYSDSVSTMPILNTTRIVFKSNKADSLSSFYIGGDAISNFRGRINEYMFFDEFQDLNTIRKWQTYFGIKYGITLTSQDYINTYGDIIWSQDSLFNKCICGIGKDTLIGLIQNSCKSESEQDLIRMFYNSQYHDNIEDGSFIVWGHDGKSTSLEYTEDSLSTFAFEKMERTWQVKVTGDSLVNIPTTIVFDNSKNLIQNPLELFLVVNRSGELDFNILDCEIFVPDSVSLSGEIFYNNINWEIDTSGSDMFTFVLMSDTIGVRQQENLASSTDDEEKNEISEKVELKSYNLYPNPTSGQFRFEALYSGQTDVKIKLFDIRGIELKRWEYKNTETIKLDGNIKETGVYFLEVIRNGDIISLKIVVI